MKKMGILFLAAFIGVLSVGQVHAEGQNSDEETSCEAVNQQMIKDGAAAEGPSATSSGATSAQGI